MGVWCFDGYNGLENLGNSGTGNPILYIVCCISKATEGKLERHKCKNSAIGPKKTVWKKVKKKKPSKWKERLYCTFTAVMVIGSIW